MHHFNLYYVLDIVYIVFPYIFMCCYSHIDILFVEFLGDTIWAIIGNFLYTGESMLIVSYTYLVFLFPQSAYDPYWVIVYRNHFYFFTNLMKILDHVQPTKYEIMLCSNLIWCMAEILVWGLIRTSLYLSCLYFMIQRKTCVFLYFISV